MLSIDSLQRSRVSLRTIVFIRSSTIYDSFFTKTFLLFLIVISMGLGEEIAELCQTVLVFERNVSKW